MSDEILAQIDAAFRVTPRPPDSELLHPQCFDDNDIVALYGIGHWRELTDAQVEREYAALSFLSPAGYRHFIPAYLSFALRHLNSGAAAVDSTIWSLAPVFYEGEALQAFTTSKLDALDETQVAAVVAFLRRAGTDDALTALRWWTA